MRTVSTTGKKAKSRRSPAIATPLQAKTEAAAARHADIHPLDRAIAELRSELARSPDDATLLGRLAALYYRRGDLIEAEKQYRRAISLAPHRPTLYNNMGNVLCDMGRMRDGIAAYEHAIEQEKAAGRTPSPEALVNLELARVENRLVHERIEYLEKASQLEVSSAETLNSLGCAYLLRGQRERALATFRKAAAMDSRNAEAGVNIAFAHTLSLSASADLKAALAEVAEAVLRFPGERRVHLHQGELLESTGMLEGAEERYLRALQTEPRCLEACDLLGRLREATGLGGTRDDTAYAVEEILARLEDAARAQIALSRGAPQAQSLYDLAYVQVARARFTRRPLADQAAVDALLREALTSAAAGAGSAKQAEPGSPQGQDPRPALRQPGAAFTAQAAILRAQLLEADGRCAEARMILENAGKAQPENARLWFERGALALRAGDIELAVASFDHATLAAPQDAVAYHSLRFAFEGYRRYRAEHVRFESATAANPRDALAHHHIALAALAVLKNEESLFHFTRAVELDPRLSDAACGRGRALQRLGHIEEAEAAYTKALEIDPENAEAQRSLVAVRSQRLLSSAGAAAKKPR